MEAGHHEVAARLLHHRASLTYKLPSTGGTAFHLAASLGRVRCGQVLLAHAAKEGVTGLTLLLKIKNKAGRTPVELAQVTIAFDSPTDATHNLCSLRARRWPGTTVFST